MELHHIILTSEGGENSAENCIPLCFECHADMKSYDFKHPKGLKYTSIELKMHRDNWFGKVSTTPTIFDTNSASLLDKELLNETKILLPWNGVILFMKTHSFGAIYRISEIDALHSYVNRCDDPSFEFLDTELESLRAGLLGAISEFLDVVAEKNFCDERNPEYSVIPREWDKVDMSLRRQAEALLNKAASKVVEEYNKLIKAGKIKLGI